MSPYFSAEDLQISGTVFHSSEATTPLPDSNELSRKGAHLLVSGFSVYIQKFVVGTRKNQNKNVMNRKKNIDIQHPVDTQKYEKYGQGYMAIQRTRVILAKYNS